MYIIDFEYDGEMLSDHGAIIGSITTGDENRPLGTNLTTNTVQNLDINYITSSQYDEVLTRTFEIIKNPCTNMAQEEMYFTDEEIYDISTWLEKKQYKKFKPLYDDGSFADLVFYGMFSVEAVPLNGHIIGFNLLLTTNAPYGFGDEQYIAHTLNSFNDECLIINDSQEPGFLYPDSLIVQCLESGTLKFYNEDDSIIGISGEHSRTTEVRNCQSGEVLVFDCKHKTLTSSNELHLGLYNDFNFNFPRLKSANKNQINRFKLLSTTEPLSKIKMEMKFLPIRKVGVI